VRMFHSMMPKWAKLIAQIERRLGEMVERVKRYGQIDDWLARYAPARMPIRLEAPGRFGPPSYVPFARRRTRR